MGRRVMMVVSFPRASAVPSTSLRTGDARRYRRMREMKFRGGGRAFPSPTWEREGHGTGGAMVMDPLQLRGTVCRQDIVQVEC